MDWIQLIAQSSPDLHSVPNTWAFYHLNTLASLIFDNLYTNVFKVFNQDCQKMQSRFPKILPDILLNGWTHMTIQVTEVDFMNLQFITGLVRPV